MRSLYFLYYEFGNFEKLHGRDSYSFSDREHISFSRNNHFQNIYISFKLCVFTIKVRSNLLLL